MTKKKALGIGLYTFSNGSFSIFDANSNGGSGNIPWPKDAAGDREKPVEHFFIELELDEDSQGETIISIVSVEKA